MYQYPPQNMMELPTWVKPDVEFWYNFPEEVRGRENHNHGRKFHVRGIVDGRAVIREWWKSKQRWNYTVEGPSYFAVFGDRIVTSKP